jgi:hypothetical protein
MPIVLTNGNLLEGDATTASKVTYVVSGLDGTTLIRLASGQLPNAKGTLCTAVGTDVVRSIQLFNTNTSAEAVNLYVQDGTTSRQIVGIDSFGAGYHAQFDGDTLVIEDNNGIIVSVSTHASTHQDGGADEISVTGLSGLLADDQHVLDTEVTAVAVAKALYDAYTILMATTNDTPEAITIAAQQVVGRITGSAIKGLSVAELQTLIFSAALGAEIVLGESYGLALDAALADGKYCGITDTPAGGSVAGATLIFGDLVYQAVGDDRWELTDANTAATATMKTGICVQAAANDGSATTILLWGKVRADAAFPALTKYAVAYMGEVAGDIVTAVPTTASCYVRVMGYGNSADELFFCPEPGWIKLVA